MKSLPDTSSGGFCTVKKSGLTSIIFLHTASFMVYYIQMQFGRVGFDKGDFMKLLVIDGNSILNRAFYGIKLLTTKDGHFTNGIYGFLNIYLRLRELCAPDAVAVAFDLRAPTFRHKMYDGYKAQRKGMPPELAEQLPVLKELLGALGLAVLECEGYEADDILGTLSVCGEKDFCYLATGDRDSLQLVGERVHVLLAATKMGRAVTTEYDEAAIRAEYGVEPRQLIEIKALMGDSSDNIPGVAGVGQKTAMDLIQRFHSLDEIYAELDTIDVKPGVRAKLEKDRDMAFLSRTLGTVCREAPVDCAIENYVPAPPDDAAAMRLLTRLEMFRMAERFGLDQNAAPAEAQEEEKPEEIQFLPGTQADGQALLARLREAGKACFLAAMQGGEIIGLAVAEPGAVTTLSAQDAGFLDFVKALFADDQIEKYTHDTKPLYAAGERLGVTLTNVQMDTMLAGYLLNPSASGYDVLRLAQEYGVPVPPCVQIAEQEREAAQQAAVMPRLCEQLARLVAENGQAKLLYEVELPLARVLAGMEQVGFEADRKGIEAFGEMLSDRIHNIVREIYNAVGYEFNLNSPRQLGEALFNKLGLPARKKTKSGYSTNAEVLESLADEHPAVERILEYRTLAKLKSTYCEGLIKVTGPDGRIHSTLNQTETRTGRISSTEPNLQNIPVRQELGREMRRFFRAREGCVLADADYSQIELRVLAHMADDRAMIEAFNSEADIHTITASQVFNMPPELVTPLMRSRAKAVNFGIVYGIGAFSLAKDIGVTRKEADQYIKGYLAHYEGVRGYMERVVREAKEQGYVSTLFGRRRYLPELTASNANLRAFGERVARNMPIQGTAADIIKIAMIRVDERLRRERMQARLIMQVHDELIVEAPEEEAERAAQILDEEMEGACDMQVRLQADVHQGKTWYDAKG